MADKYNSFRLKFDNNNSITACIRDSREPNNVNIFAADSQIIQDVGQIGLLDKYNNPQLRIINGAIEIVPQIPDPDKKKKIEFNEKYSLERQVELLIKGQIKNSDSEFQTMLNEFENGVQQR